VNVLLLFLLFVIKNFVGFLETFFS